MKFASGIAEVLGFRTDTQYKFHRSDISTEGIRNSNIVSPLKGVDYLYVYSDIVQPTYFGGQLVNILDCFVLESATNKGLNNVVYRPLNNHLINSISITVLDQLGRPIFFENQSVITCIVHIREKIR